MPKLTYTQLEVIFLDNLNNAINANYDIPPGIVISKEASKNIGDGLKLIVHSNDHDTHFHIIHKERGINARFTFPVIAFQEYITCKKAFSSRQIKNIVSTCNTYHQFIQDSLTARNDERA